MVDTVSTGKGSLRQDPYGAILGMGTVSRRATTSRYQARPASSNPGGMRFRQLPASEYRSVPAEWVESTLDAGGARHRPVACRSRWTNTGPWGSAPEVSDLEAGKPRSITSGGVLF